MKFEDGVIKFNYKLDVSDRITAEMIEQINAARKQLYNACLIGVDRSGIGYGNISKRLSRNNEKTTFLISGTQTGEIHDLTEEHYTTVVDYDYDKFFVQAEGPIAPSSESLTHAALYDLSEKIEWVIHIHDLLLWEYLLESGFPAVDDATYGSQELAKAVQQLYSGKDPLEENIFAMKGHVSGVVSFGDTVEKALSPIFYLINEAVME